jgi:hypothetical protein
VLEMRPTDQGFLATSETGQGQDQALMALAALRFEHPGIVHPFH